MKNTKALFLTLFISISTNLFAEQKDISPPDVIHWQLPDSTQLDEAKGIAILQANLETEQGFSIYADRVKFTSTGSWVLESIIPPKTELKQDPLSNHEKPVFTGGIFKFMFVSLDPALKVVDPILFSIKFLGCTNKICLFPFTQNFELGAKKSILNPSLLEEFKNFGKKPEEFWNESSVYEEQKIPKEASVPLLQPISKEETLPFSFSTLALAFSGGLLTNFTPCVFPMIPITIRLLGSLTQSPLTGALFYSGGILTSYFALGALAATSGMLFGSFSQNPIFNILIAFLLFFLAHSLLTGAGFSTLQNWGDKLGRNSKGGKAAFLMGCGSGLVAAPCTGPILGALLATSTSSTSIIATLLPIFFYSLGFALPYVFLGFFSSQIKSIKVSPMLLNLIKWTFASVLSALGFYYLRIPFYSWFVQITPHYWLILAGVTSLFGFLLFLVPFAKNLNHLLLGLGLVCGFFGVTQKTSLLHWQKPSVVEGQSLKSLYPSGKVIIDFWAEWCESCKEMDRVTFSDEKVQEKLLSWTLIKVDVTEFTAITDGWLNEFKVKGLPSLVILHDGQFTVVPGFIAPEKLLEKLNADTRMPAQ